MIIPKMKQELLSVDDNLIATYCAEFGLSELLVRILVNRGITTKEQVAKYLKPDLDHLYDPYLLKGLDVAVERIKYAVEMGEKVAIYGDYDVDGITSVSLLLKMFTQLGGTAEYYIPNRSREGYGLHKAALDSLHQQGVALVITVDTGISCVGEAAYAEAGKVAEEVYIQLKTAYFVLH